MFFEVHRLVLQPGAFAAQHTGDRFQVPNLVEGEGVTIRSAAGEHFLAYAETVVIPAAVGSYEIAASGASPVRLVRAFAP